MTAAHAVPDVHAARLASVREDLSKKKLDALLVQNRADQYWLTGFTGEDGFVILSHKHVVLLTDGRFDETADREAPWARKVIRQKRTADETVRELKRMKIGRLGFEPSHMSVLAFGELKKLAKSSRLVAASGIIRTRRLIKDAREVTLIRNAIHAAEEAFRRVRHDIRPGMTEREVAAKLIYEMHVLGASEPAFGPIVAAGPNASLPHYEAGNRRISRGEPVLIDWGARVNWYVSDLTRVIWLDSIPPKSREILDVVRAAHDRAIAVIRPGVSAAAVDNAARAYIRKSGYGKQFRHSVGHGIGLDVHEGPGLRKTNKDPLKAGMVVTIEPGIYLPGVGGARIESDVLVTERGCEILSTLPLV
ncbi:putative peptidase [Phycisphaerae bacterium RAS1]|nr:putative peptidase [Phycisphaerae bacterium RAS1]